MVFAAPGRLAILFAENSLWYVFSTIEMTWRGQVGGRWGDCHGPPEGPTVESFPSPDTPDRSGKLRRNHGATAGTNMRSGSVRAGQLRTALVFFGSGEVQA